jgi:hypothetical protein
MFSDVQLVFPEPSSPASVHALVTTLHNYGIELELGNSLTFDVVHLGTSNGKIVFEGQEVRPGF